VRACGTDGSRISSRSTAPQLLREATQAGDVGSVVHGSLWKEFEGLVTDHVSAMTYTAPCSSSVCGARRKVEVRRLK
jgi:hypothetical protein